MLSINNEHKKCLDQNKELRNKEEAHLEIIHCLSCEKECLENQAELKQNEIEAQKQRAEDAAEKMQKMGDERKNVVFEYNKLKDSTEVMEAKIQD